MSAKRKAEDIDENIENKQSKISHEEKETEATEVSSGATTEETTVEEADDKSLVIKKPDECGLVLLCGGTDWDTTGRKKKNSKVKGNDGLLWSPHRFAPLNGVRVRLVASGTHSCHSIIVTEEGRAMSFGRNEKGQLGVGDLNCRNIPTLMESVKDYNIVAAACGKNHSLVLTDRGVVFGCGDNKSGQCGVGNTNPLILTATLMSYTGPPIVKVNCGAEFSVVLDCKGFLHSFGLPEYGQLGHNTDGKYFVTNNKLGYHCETSPKRVGFFIEKAKDGHITPIEVFEIIDFSCGSNHTVAVDAKRRVFSWGFGGYGRLGHAEQKDEMIPRLVKFFEMQSSRVKTVHCGSSYSLAINDYGMVYMFGQTKRTGEANMYPKPIQDLMGWTIRSVGCSFTSIVVAADDSVIAWGPSPTYGELGIGDNRKSSTTPLEVKALEDIYVQQVSCGYGHTLLIARDHSEEEVAAIERLPEFDPE